MPMTTTARYESFLSAARQYIAPAADGTYSLFTPEQVAQRAADYEEATGKETCVMHEVHTMFAEALADGRIPTVNYTQPCWCNRPECRAARGEPVMV